MLPVTAALQINSMGAGIHHEGGIILLRQVADYFGGDDR
jgi:hypothetical protein